MAPIRPENLVTDVERSWIPDVSDIVEEAMERAQINKEAENTVFWKSAMRSLQLMQTQFASAKGYIPTIFEHSFNTMANEQDYTLPEGTLGVITASVKDDSRKADILLHGFSYSEWQNLPNKERRERPYQYFFDLRSPVNGGPQVRFYYTPDGVYEMNFVLQMMPERIESAAGRIETAERWYEAFCAELAARLCEKFGDMERCAMLQPKADRAVMLAKARDTTYRPIKTSYKRWF